MKASELRVGNKLIYHTGVSSDIITIESIDSDSVNGSFYGDYSAISLSSCEPISLTPEILAKAGFVGRYYPGEDYVSSKGEFTHLLAHKQFRFAGAMVRNIQYVHQLQNLYFALTGEELIFDL